MAGVFLPLLAAAATPSAGLDVFDRLSGHCWEGRTSATVVDVHCFEPVYGAAHVRDRHRVLVDGKPAYEGETIYSREKGQLVFVYFNSLGGVGRGVAVPDDLGICFTGTMRASPDAEPQAVASCWRWRKDGYSVTSGDAAPVPFVESDKRLRH